MTIISILKVTWFNMQRSSFFLCFRARSVRHPQTRLTLRASLTKPPTANGPVTPLWKEAPGAYHAKHKSPSGNPLQSHRVGGLPSFDGQLHYCIIWRGCFYAGSRLLFANYSKAISLNRAISLVRVFSFHSPSLYCFLLNGSSR